MVQRIGEFWRFCQSAMDEVESLGARCTKLETSVQKYGRDKDALEYSVPAACAAAGCAEPDTPSGL